MIPEKGYIVIFASVIVSTYNWPQALNLVLSALENQTVKNFEVIVADDGSREETTTLVNDFKNRKRLNLKHVWHPDEGFRAAEIRNKALLSASGQYVIFIDGDSIPFPNFIERHLKLAERGWLVSGNRILLSQTFTASILSDDLAIYRWSLLAFFKKFMQKEINRFHTLLPLPLGIFRYLKASQWKGAKTCNLGIWMSDLQETNGFDESYVGWGYEDSDLIIRLMNKGVRRKSGGFAVPVLHLWHPESSRHLAGENYQKLLSLLKEKRVVTPYGLKKL
jgi:glycosyltransferase involved in cell wall biosynthesis